MVVLTLFFVHSLKLCEYLMKRDVNVWLKLHPSYAKKIVNISFILFYCQHPVRFCNRMMTDCIY